MGGGGGGLSDDVSSSVIIFILSSPFIQYIQFYSQETEIAYFHSQFGVFTNKTSPNWHLVSFVVCDHFCLLNNVSHGGSSKPISENGPKVFSV